MDGLDNLNIKDMLTTELYVIEKAGRLGLAEKSGKILLDYEYDEFSKFNSYGVAHVKKGNRFGAINKFGKLIFPCIIDKVLYNDDTFAVVSASNKHMILDVKTYSKRCEYDEIVFLKSPYMQNLALVKNGGYVGILDVINNVEVIPCLFDSIEEFENSAYLVKQGNLMGIKSKTGESILECEYTQINQDVNEFSLTIQNTAGKWGVVNKTTGRVLIDCKYDKIDVLNPDKHPELRKIENNGKIGIFNTATGKEVVPCIYDSFEPNYELGIIHVKQNGKYGILNENGEILVECVSDKKFERINKHFLCGGDIYFSVVSNQIFTKEQFGLITKVQTGKIDYKTLPEELLSSAKCLKELVELARFDLKKHNHELQNEDALKFADFVQCLIEQKKNYEMSLCSEQTTGIQVGEVQEFSKYAKENIVSITTVLVNIQTLAFQYTGEDGERGSR